MKLPGLKVLAVVALVLAACGTDQELPPTGALLEPPPHGQGVQLTTFDFEVEAGTEVQDCYFFRISDLAAQSGIPPNDVILHRTQIAYREGSHHMNIFRVRRSLGSIRQTAPSSAASMACRPARSVPTGPIGR